MNRIFLAAIVTVGLCASVDGAVLDSNFEDTPFVDAGAQLTGMEWAPDGSNRLFVTRKAGEIVIVENGVLLPTPFATISPIYSLVECGLLGLWFDPDFVNNGYLYVFVTVSSGEQQIIRYTAVGNIGTNKTVLVANLPTFGGVHNGGGVGIGSDGKIYWSIGDNGGGVGVNADLASLGSKVGRANRDGSVPADNPFVDGPGGNNDYIWARGLRNPFTLTFHPETGHLWVNCVGTFYEQIFLMTRGDHAGWSNFENTQPAGFITPKIKYRTNGSEVRNIAPGTGAVRSGNVTTFTTTSDIGLRQGEKVTIAGVADPGFNGSVYIASVTGPNTFTAIQPGPDASSGGGTLTTINYGGCVTGGCFYNTTGVPQAYRQNFFFGDLNTGFLVRTALAGATNISTVDLFGTSPSQQIDIALGPDGAMYYGNLFGPIRRIAYTNFTSQQIIATPAVVRMQEGGATMVGVRLAMPPPGDVSVNVAKASGDADLTAGAGATLTFTPADWSVPQMIRLEAARDDDAANDTASFTLSAAGVPSEDITVHALDVKHLFSLSAPVPGQPVQITLNGQPGNTYILEGSTNLVMPWLPIHTNTLSGASTNFTDPSANLRFYRARLVP